MCDQVRIGYLKNSDRSVYLEKHRWDCDWYWGFGYLNTSREFFHFSSMIPNQSDKNKIVFDFDTIVLDKGLDGWMLMELFQEAYVLKSVAELHYMGHTGIAALDLSLKDENKYKEYNKMLEKILDKIWDHVTKKGDSND